MLIRQSSEFNLVNPQEYKKELYNLSSSKKLGSFLFPVNSFSNSSVLSAPFFKRLASPVLSCSNSFDLKKNEFKNLPSFLSKSDLHILSLPSKGLQVSRNVSQCNGKGRRDMIKPLTTLIHKSFESISLFELYKSEQFNKQTTTGEALSKYPSVELKVISNTSLYDSIEQLALIDENLDFLSIDSLSTLASYRRKIGMKAEKKKGE
jgi:hypothetical protein